LFLINTGYYVEVENGALLRDVARSWKIILGVHGKSWKSHGKFLEKSIGTLFIYCRKITGFDPVLI